MRQEKAYHIETNRRLVPFCSLFLSSSALTSLSNRSGLKILFTPELLASSREEVKELHQNGKGKIKLSLL